MVVDNLGRNGIAAYVLNTCSQLDHKQIAPFIVVGGGVDSANAAQAKAMGIPIIALPNRKRHPVAYLHKLSQILRAQRPQIVHVHGNSRTMALELSVAKRCHCSARIAHSHNSTCDHKLLHRLLKPVFVRSYTHGLACGSKAGRWLFEDRPFAIAPNGIDVAHFLFDGQTRECTRAELGLEGKFVIGHVGGLNTQKNQAFLIASFEQVAQRDSQAVLLLVGAGPLEAELKRQVASSPFISRILFYGPSEDPSKLYQAMDMFALPSLFEGLPISLLEAQSAGLPCLVANNIDSDVVLTNQVTALPLEAGTQAWAQEIARIRQSAQTHSRSQQQAQELRSIDTTHTARVLLNQYQSFLSLPSES
ncbi:glycosyltransferase [Bombiscardovia apis]|nr:glycosyltransferase [Bombiscardovia apis]